MEKEKKMEHALRRISKRGERERQGGSEGKQRYKYKQNKRDIYNRRGHFVLLQP